MSINQWVLTRQDIRGYTPDDGDELGVFENSSIYSYSATCTEVDDNNIYITPFWQGGRWVKTKSFAVVNHVHSAMYTQEAIDNKIVLLPAVRHNHGEDLYMTNSELQNAIKDCVPLSILPNFEVNMPSAPRVAYIASSAPIAKESGKAGIWCDTNGVLWFWDGTNNKKIKLT